MSEEAYQVKSVKTNLRILKTLSEIESGGVSEVASAVNLPRSTTYVHLNTLAEQGLLVKNDSDYHLGLPFLQMGEIARKEKTVYRVSRPEIEKLADDTGELVNLATIEDNTGYYLYRSSGENAISLDTYAGKEFPLHCTALGKAMLSSLPKEKRESLMEGMQFVKRTNHSITSKRDLIDDLDEIMDQGFAIDYGEWAEGARCVAAPIRVDPDIIAAISITGPVSRMNKNKLEKEFPELLLNSANMVELELKYGAEGSK